MNCQICFKNFSDINDLNCQHFDIYCQSCLDQWGKGKCPCCQKVIKDWKKWISIQENFESIIEQSIEKLTKNEFKMIGEYEPSPDKGFAFDNSIFLREIRNKVLENGLHSGASYGFTMRYLSHYSKIYFQSVYKKN